MNHDAAPRLSLLVKLDCDVCHETVLIAAGAATMAVIAHVATHRKPLAKTGAAPIAAERRVKVYA